MNRKVPLMVLALAVVLLATPYVGTAMADSPKKIQATATDPGNLAAPPSNVDIWYTPGEIAHISIVWEGQLVLHEGGNSFTFDYVINVEGNGPEGFTLEDGDKVQHDPTKGVFQVKEVWTYTDGDETDTFEGVAHWTMTMPYITQYSSRIVLQGFGIFKGQTLSLSGDFGFGNDNTYYGYLLVP